MAKRNSISSALSNEGLEVRRLYFTMGAAVLALEYLLESKYKPESFAVAAQSLDILMCRMKSILDGLGIPDSLEKGISGSLQ